LLKKRILLKNYHDYEMFYLQEHDMPEDPYAEIFTIWMCSDSLGNYAFTVTVYTAF